MRNSMRKHSKTKVKMSRVALCVFTLVSMTYRYQKAKNFQKDTPSVLRQNGKYLDSDLR
jgi:hypothetical protein